LSNLIDHAQAELKRAGLGDADADYGGMLEDAVMELITTFSQQGHSGFSAAVTLDIFNRLANFKPLGDITNDPNEWMEVGMDVWQNKRRSTSFSRDGGKTWYDIEDSSLNNGDTWRHADGTRTFTI